MKGIDSAVYTVYREKMARINTLEDDITFERVRHMPRRTRVCSMHRQLSWACQKEIQLYEKDTKVTTNNLERSKTAMQGRFRQLVKAKKDLARNKTDLTNRRASCPEVFGEDMAKIRVFQQPDFAKRKGREEVSNATVSSDDSIFDGLDEKTQFQKHFPRSVSMYGKPVTVNCGKRELETVVKSNNKDTVRFERRQTMPAL